MKKNIISEMLKSSAIGIAVSLMIFCTVGVVVDIASNGSFGFENYSFTKMFFGCIAVGFGFGVPSVIYNRESLPMPIKILVHMGVGILIFTLTAYIVGFAGNSDGALKNALILIGELAAALMVWGFFMLYYRREAKKMNEKLQKIKLERNNFC